MKIFIYSLVTIVFLAMTIPCQAGGNRHRGGHHDSTRHGHGHHHHDHHYRWFGVIPRPQWAPYSGYYAVPQYNYPAPYYPMPPPLNFSIGTPTVTGLSQPEGTEIIIVPQERQSFEDYQKPIRIPIPEASVQERQASIQEQVTPQPTVPRLVAPKRIDPSKAATVEKYVTGEASCPLDLPKGGIVRVCNARSGKYKISQQGNEKYFHQQQCWLCENILGGDYVRWQDRVQ